MIPHARGGATHVRNGQGTCAGCNYAKEAPGWQARAAPDGAITTTTPTGHRYLSPVPEPPGRPRRRTDSPVERQLAAMLAAS